MLSPLRVGGASGAAHYSLNLMPVPLAAPGHQGGGGLVVTIDKHNKDINNTLTRIIIFINRHQKWTQIQHIIKNSHIHFGILK